MTDAAKYDNEEHLLFFEIPQLIGLRVGFAKHGTTYLDEGIVVGYQLGADGWIEVEANGTRHRFPWDTTFDFCRVEPEHDWKGLAVERMRYIGYLESFFPDGIPNEGPEGTQAEWMAGERF